MHEDVDPSMEYRSVDRWAVAGCTLGLLSPLAFVTEVLWLIPLLAVVASAVALRRLAVDDSRSGRGAALFGLGMALLFGVAPLSQRITTQLILREQARPLAEQFLEYLRQDHPERALMLHAMPDYRQPLDNDLWDFFRNDQESQVKLRKFLQNPTTRALLALGTRADIQYYKTAAVGIDTNRAVASYWFTVTYDDAGKKKTFIVSVLMERNPTKQASLHPWRITSLTGVDPYGN